MDPSIGASLSENERRRLQEIFAAAVNSSAEAARLEDAASRDQQLQWATGPLSGGNMDYSDALHQAILEMPLKWDFSTWDYRTASVCAVEETEAIHHYGIEERSRVESEEEQTDSEDDEYMDDIELQSTLVAKKGGRRESVSAEQVGGDIKPAELKKVPKREEESARIQEILRENIMFKHLDVHQTDQVKDAMFLVEHEPGDVVIREGDAGDNFYVIDEGTFDVFIKKADVETKVKSMGPGESFGELALMYSTPRTATCKAVTKARLWALDRISFKVILQATTTARRAQHKTFLESVPTLEQLTEYEILTIADALVEVSYDDGDLVCTQGEVGDAFYIIKKGSASVLQSDALGDVQEIARLDTGHYFGEVALIFAQPRGATVKAVGQLQLLSLDRRTFKRVMGPMENILQRNMKSYKRIAASNI